MNWRVARKYFVLSAFNLLCAAAGFIAKWSSVSWAGWLGSYNMMVAVVTIVTTVVWAVRDTRLIKRRLRRELGVD